MSTMQSSHMTASGFGVERGVRAVSADNKRLGVVNDVRGPYFRVHRRPFGGNHWFDVNDVLATFEDQVFLSFAKRSTAEHEIPAEVVNDGRLDARADHLLNDDELLAQRQRMERDLGVH